MLTEDPTTTLQLDTDVVFRTPIGPPVRVHVTKLVVEDDGGVRSVAAEGAVDWPTYLRIRDEELFTYFPAVRTEQAAFEEGGEVELRLRLRPSVAAALARRNLGVDVLLAGLIDPGSHDDVALAWSESWLVAELKQQVTLPESLQDEGTLKVGMRTRWAAGETAAPLEAAESAAETIRLLLEVRGWRYDRVQDGLFRIPMGRDDLRWMSLATVDADQPVVGFYSVYPWNVDAKVRERVAGYLVDLNYQLILGSFDMDMDDGEIRFRTSLVAPNQRLDAAAFGAMMDAHIVIFAGELNDLANALRG